MHHARYTIALRAPPERTLCAPWQNSEISALETKGTAIIIKDVKKLIGIANYK